MSRWFRFYDTVLDDPKVQRLSDPAFRAWVNLMCVASKNDGIIQESWENLSFALRKSEGKTRELIQILMSAGLIDVVENGLEPHNWRVRQYKSDVSTERVKRFRKRRETVSETAPDTEQIQTQKKEERAAPTAQPVALPIWLDHEAWEAFLEMRRRKRAPVTKRAVELLLGKLDRWRVNGHDPTIILDASTASAWTNLYEPKDESSNGRLPRKSNHETFFDAASAVAARIQAGPGEEAGSPHEATILLLPSRSDKAPN